MTKLKQSAAVAARSILTDNFKFVVLGLVVAILFLGFWYFRDGIGLLSSNSIKVSFLVAPTDAQVYIDGEPMEDDARLAKGNYLVTVSRDGFESMQEVISLPKDKARAYALLPNSELGKAVKQDNADYFRNVAKAMESQKSKDIEKYRKQRNKIIEHLPFENLLFKIDYRVKPQDIRQEQIVVRIQAKDGYRELALQQIRHFGLEPTHLDIEFVDVGGGSDVQ